ncbi:hypothetical protein K7432_006500 [Basidiobolus ranarum]|uniref:Uncharacterized protein n=1 Tax=Basidiobolus ranarum TaxID=34480 RepID=A0ABR2WUV3_9FUNG
MPTLMDSSLKHWSTFAVDVGGSSTYLTLSDKDNIYKDVVYTDSGSGFIHDSDESIPFALVGLFFLILFCIVSMMAYYCLCIYLQHNQSKWDDGELIDSDFMVNFEDTTDTLFEPAPPYSGASYFSLTEWAVESISNALYTRQLTTVSDQRCLINLPDVYPRNQPYDRPPPPSYEEVASVLIEIGIE